jgi:predicted lipoprotein with Yx(FWY)xxD motif
VEAPWLATAEGDWSVVSRSDGTRQWAYQGRPLYRYINDAVTTEAGGDGVGKWHALVLEPPPPVPDWVRVQASDAGDLYSDQSGRTLYAHDVAAARGRDGGVGVSILRPQDWKPVLAAPGAKPVGSWSIVEEDGVRQWAWRGLPLYTNELDSVPGELRGIRRPDHTWKTIMRNGRQMDGTGA